MRGNSLGNSLGTGLQIDNLTAREQAGEQPREQPHPWWMNSDKVGQVVPTGITRNGSSFFEGIKSDISRGSHVRVRTHARRRSLNGMASASRTRRVHGGVGGKRGKEK